MTHARKILAVLCLLSAPAFGQATQPIPSNPIGPLVVWSWPTWMQAWGTKADVLNGTLTNPSINGGSINGSAAALTTLIATGTISGAGDHIAVCLPSLHRLHDAGSGAFHDAGGDGGGDVLGGPHPHSLRLIQHRRICPSGWRVRVNHSRHRGVDHGDDR